MAKRKKYSSEHGVPLNAREFEDFVAHLVAGLQFAKGGIVSARKRFPGIRQVGEYEIDVSLEVSLSEELNFLLIVECKNWKRLVGREVIQKIAQTKDAIIADKAAVASAVGFTEDALETAKSLGVALWTVSVDEWIANCSQRDGGFCLDLVLSGQNRD